MSDPIISTSREGQVELAAFDNHYGRTGWSWNWLQLRFIDQDGETRLRDYVPIEHKEAAIKWANQSVDSLKEAFFAIVEAVADADSDDVLGSIDVDLPRDGYPRQWLQKAARHALNRDPFTNKPVEAV